MPVIAIVDDKASVRTTLQERFSNLPGFTVCFTAQNGNDFLAKMKDARVHLQPDVVLMDIDMPVLSGIEAVAESKLRFPLVKILMLTIFDEDDKIFQAIKAGADGYLLKDEPVDKIAEAVKHIMNDEGAPMSPSIARRVLQMLSTFENNRAESPKPAVTEDYNLSVREREILTMLVDGMEYKEIAEQLGLSPNTIRNHVAKIYRKLHVTSRAQAARIASNLSRTKRY
jgi:DNA-binding NarL/FixJ family response regulator